MTMKLFGRLLLAGGLATALAAGGCGGSGSNGGGSPAASFGNTFLAAFQALMNDDPINPMPGDAGAIDLTAEPVDL